MESRLGPGASLRRINRALGVEGGPCMWGDWNGFIGLTT